MKRRRRKPDPYITRIAKLKLAPGDVVVLQTDVVLKREQMMEMHKIAKPWFPKNKVIVLTAGIKLGVIETKPRRMLQRIPR